MNKKTNTVQKSRGTKATREASGKYKDKNIPPIQTSINHYLNNIQSNINSSKIKSNNIYHSRQSPLLLSSSRVVDNNSVSLNSTYKAVDQLAGHTEVFVDYKLGSKRSKLEDPPLGNGTPKRYCPNAQLYNDEGDNSVPDGDSLLTLPPLCSSPKQSTGGRETMCCLSSKNADITPADLTSQIDDTLPQDLGSRCSVADIKRKPRKKPARKRTPKTAILPRKRPSSIDDIQENILQLNTQYHIVKAKRRRLYAREQNEGQCPVIVTNRADTMVNGVLTKLRLSSS